MKKMLKTILIACITLLVAVGIVPITTYATSEENPRVIIEAYSISEDEIIPGQEFELTMTIRNTSQFYDIYNVVVTFEDNSNSIYPVYGTSNQCYINRIYARNNTEITIPLQASDDIVLGVIPLEFTISYNDNYFIEKQINDMEIFLPVRLVGDLNIVSSSFPNSVSVGAKARIIVTYENTGSKNLYNVKLKVVANGKQGEELVTELYDINGGAKNTAEVYLDCKNIGNIPISFYFTYEDDNGETYETSTISQSIIVVDSTANDVSEDSITPVVGEENSGLRVALACIISVAIVILLLLNKRRR